MMSLYSSNVMVSKERDLSWIVAPFDDDDYDKWRRRKTLEFLGREMMHSSDFPYLLEKNIRMGDPESFNAFIYEKEFVYECDINARVHPGKGRNGFFFLLRVRIVRRLQLIVLYGSNLVQFTVY